ncbi:uncharacterized protein LOC132194549 isoform X2 [Neocloeon triangulifer]|uniref:uncharacterized protein LOC132194549 isoform X2 n=1 Tax=Neocloeon triangulifer TaxID=2078957 RepID=UPI00286F12A3|nr:uncharacterized protein LOC132194549 isoform X2 [Neocloeon triangulifer]
MRAVSSFVVVLLLLAETRSRGYWGRRSRLQDAPWRIHYVAAPPLRKNTADLLYELSQPGMIKLKSDAFLDENVIEDEDNQIKFGTNGITSTFIKEAKDEEVARFLNLLTLVRFSNSECLSEDGLVGSCYPDSECVALGGVIGGSCANGFGVCCVFIGTCGDRLQANGSYFQSPNFPEIMPTPTRPKSCYFEILKTNPWVTHVRVDFEFFQLSNPTAGECQNDRMIISGQDEGSPVPPLCGSNTGQHIYFELLNKQTPVRFTVISLSNSSVVVNRRWRIRITQLNPRDLPLAAPSHCLQYYSSPTGVVQSFNYEGGAYTKMPGACSITYRNTNVAGQESRFQIVNVERGGQSIIPVNQAGAGVFNCPDDYIVVSGVRLCGEKLNDATTNIDFTVNAPVTDTTSGPFILPFRTNAGNVGQGFSLVYSQNACALS